MATAQEKVALEMTFAKALLRADVNGKRAAEECEPTLMSVSGYPTSFPVCGFAWVNVKPGTSKFARFLVKSGMAHKSYEGGVSIWVSEYDQSHDHKLAYARAFADTLIKELVAGQVENLTIVAGSRLD